jgi:hypothetical protein
LLPLRWRLAPARSVQVSFVTKAGEWICECANDEYFQHLALSADKYEAIRHERVTERNTRY